MKIYVTTTFEALHNWEGAPDGRKYLRHPHRHTFGVTAWADVSHPDRDIEFHDLKRKVDDVIGSILLGHYSRDESLPFLGTMSCEHIGREILEAVPELCAVEVDEDGEFGAYIKAENPEEYSSADCGLTRHEQDWLNALEELTEENDNEFFAMPVATICGSTRHKQAWLDAMKLLEEEGVASFQVGSFMHADGHEISESQKIFFDALHKRKIDISDFIYVLNVDGYVGESTASEVRYAQSLGIYVRWLEPDKIPKEFLPCKSVKR